MSGCLSECYFVRSKWLKRIMPVWTFLIFIIQHGVLSFFLFALYNGVGQFGTFSHIVMVTIVSTYTYFEYLILWRKNQMKAMISSFEKDASKEEEILMKKVIYLMLGSYLFCAATLVVVNCFSIAFADDEEVKRITDEYFFFFGFDVSRNQTVSKKLLIPIQAFVTSELAVGVSTTITVFLCMYVHLKIKLQKVFDEMEYTSALDLRKARKRLARVEEIMEGFNAFFTNAGASAVAQSMFMSAMAVHCILGEDGAPSRFTANAVSGAVIITVLTSLFATAAVLFVDVKSSYPVCRVYQVSAQVDPEDDDYAMEAELLAKQMEQTKIVCTLWTFYKVQRLAILNVYSAYFSYCFLSIELNAHFSAFKDSLLTVDD